MFICLLQPGDPGTTESIIVDAQNRLTSVMDNLDPKRPLRKTTLDDITHLWVHPQTNQLVVPPDQELYRQILQRWHGLPTAGHLGRDETTCKILEFYHWPNASTWIAQYIKGCAICQQNKNITCRLRIPLYKITTTPDAKPFEQVTMDLITDLPPSQGYDAVLTLVDHGCLCAALFLPCHKTITGEKIAHLYFKHLFPWFGISRQIISDRDPRFTSHFARAMTKHLGMQQNLSTAFHPQTDGISERANQWLEQYLRLTVLYQEDWAQWLPMATVVHNNAQNTTMQQTPNTVLMGFTSTLAPSSNQKFGVPAADDWIMKMVQAQKTAIDIINQPTSIPRASFAIGERVWLEGKNLPISTGSSKLCPKRYGHFKISRVVSPVVYQLELPSQWKIHPIFHASLLLPYKETEQHGTNYIQPPPDVIQGEEQYEVEAI